MEKVKTSSWHFGVQRVGLGNFCMNLFEAGAQANFARYVLNVE